MQVEAGWFLDLTGGSVSRDIGGSEEENGWGKNRRGRGVTETYR